jgi:hypothetical protein
MNTFVFFHVGQDLRQPTMLVHSIRLTNPSAHIIQCTDLETPIVPRTTEVHRAPCDQGRLMMARLDGFSRLKLTTPAIFLDTDMLVVKQIDPANLLANKKAILCKRSFNLNGSFIGMQRGLDFSEYEGKSLGEVYPYVACATVAGSGDFWKELVDILWRLDEKFQIWYGDQEALKYWARTQKAHDVGVLQECDYGCLPEEVNFVSRAKILHFKGPTRKTLMSKFYSKIHSG